ncbi:MAG: type III-B CRISPR-associated protein Cas10/Cmr2 [Saprospiraceae bacterium]|nr:type III-B CRISPR-associated protein Cas10/Cmr2 [Saprospiraceae bacterium]
MAEIATFDFKHENHTAYKELANQYINKQEEDDQKAFFNALKNSTQFGDKLKLRTYHKYIAVVQGDGDNIGKTIQAIGGDKKMVQNFSTALFDFALAATDEIKKYGGKAVYVGGDDVLFFAPVAVFNENLNEGNGGLSSIFGLLSALDQKFEKYLINHPDLKELYKEGGKLHGNVPSMSYGVSITYSKYPLNEARDTAYALLQQAKSIKMIKIKFVLNCTNTVAIVLALP